MIADDVKLLEEEKKQHMIDFNKDNIMEGTKKKHKGRKKKYEVTGRVVGTYDEDTIPIKISLYDDELERIKEIIKTGEYDDLCDVVKDEFPVLYEQIHSTLVNAAYDLCAQEYKNYFAESEDDEPENIELIGNEYSCPIPDEWKE